MANAIAIVPVPSQNQAGAKDELQSRLDAAPLEHAAAMLALWELLEAAHDKQLIEAARGAIAAGDTIVNKLAAAAANPGAIKGMRNLVLLTEMLGSLDPETLHQVVKALPNSLAQENPQAQRPASFWQIFRQLTSADARRALGFFSSMAVALGKALDPNKPKQS